MNNCKNYEDCIFFESIETDYDITTGHSSYQDYCTRCGKNKKIIGFIHCEKCNKDIKRNKELKANEKNNS